LPSQLRKSITKGLGEMERIKSNPVAKNCNKFNKAATHVDRKKAAARGYDKYKRHVKE
jgi:hypothetical protein